MFSRTRCYLTSFLLLHFVAMTGHVIAETGVKTAKAPVHPALVQVDEDPKLPRVLLIGDSITMGYTAPLRELLAGKANVQHPAENCGPSRRILELRASSCPFRKKGWEQVPSLVSPAQKLVASQQARNPRDRPR